MSSATINMTEGGYMPISKKVYALMEKQGLTQAELSRRGGIERSHLNHILKRDENVKETTLAKLCKGLGCKPEEIMKEAE